MKRLLAILCAAVLVLSLTACGEKPVESSKVTEPATTKTEPAGSQTESAGTQTEPVAVTYPTKAVNVICPYGAGSNQDLTCRTIATLLEEKLGVPFVVKNVEGADGVTGEIELYNSPNDGYTIGATSASPTCITPYLQPDEVPYRWDSFEHIGMVLPFSHCFYAKADAPFNNLDELCAWINSQESVVCCFAGYVNLVNMMKVFEIGKVDASKVTFVPTNSKEVATSVASGICQFTCHGKSTAKPMVLSGDLKLLAPLGDQRYPDVNPDIPSAVEQGYNVFSYGGLGFSAPKGTPQEYIDILDKALQEVVLDQRYIDHVDSIGYQHYTYDAKEYAEQLKTDSELSYKYLVELGMIKQ